MALRHSLQDGGSKPAYREIIGLRGLRPDENDAIQLAASPPD
jgi:hypothetical protein